MRIVDKYRSTCASCLCHILSLRPFFAAKCLKTAILLNHSKTKGRDPRTDNIVNQGHPAMAIDTLKFSIKFQPQHQLATVGDSAQARCGPQDLSCKPEGPFDTKEIPTAQYGHKH